MFDKHYALISSFISLEKTTPFVVIPTDSFSICFDDDGKKIKGKKEKRKKKIEKKS